MNGKKVQYLEPADIGIQVQTTDTLIAGANPTREWLTIVNMGTNLVDIRLVNKGGTVTGRITLSQYGAIIITGVNARYSKGDIIWDGSVYGIATTAATNVRGIEVSRVEA